MARQSSISHVVNGYSRYDVPESKAFSCTPGIAYPVRIQFINARDRVSIEQGLDIRSNPLAVPVFNPYTIRLHRFWVPLQLYHPEMRTNSSKFDMNDLSVNWMPSSFFGGTDLENPFGLNSPVYNSLMAWLRVPASARPSTGSFTTDYNGVELPNNTAKGFYGGAWANADTYLAYWDIVRNYYSYSQWGLYQVAWPCTWYLEYNTATVGKYVPQYATTVNSFTSRTGNLEFLDAYFESQFYPGSVESGNNTYNRSNLFTQIVRSHSTLWGVNHNGYPVSPDYADFNSSALTGFAPEDVHSMSISEIPQTTMSAYFTLVHPMAVVPSSPDRFSRMLPASDSDSVVSMSGISTIPQLAVASRLQEYKDLLGAGGSRFSDWLETFFASKIEHVDRPKLLFSASSTINVQVVMNQSGYNNFSGGEGSSPLGSQGGSIAFNSRLGRRQSYYFREPGYMIDIFSIRPVYYWSAIRPDYLNWLGADYFNPIYNDIGYQQVPAVTFGYSDLTSSTMVTYSQEPCFNEFRSSYDEVLGQLSYWGSPSSGNPDVTEPLVPVYSYWVQQRSFRPSDAFSSASVKEALFVDMDTVNAPFASNVEDNFFVNLSYGVQVKNLVNKTFATRLSNR